MEKPAPLEHLKPERIRAAFRISWRLFKLVWHIDKWLLSAAAIAISIPSVIPFINAYIYKLIIDAAIEGIGSGTPDYNHLGLLIALRVASYFAQDAAFTTQNYVEQLLWTKMPIKLNTLVFEKISQLDIEYFENAEFRNALERVRDSLSFRPQNLLSNMLFMLQSAIQFTIAFVAIATLNWWLIGLIVLVAIPEFLYHLYESRAGWVIWAWNSPLKKRYTYLTSLLQEFRSLKEIRLFSLAPTFITELKELQTKFFRDNAKLAKRTFYFRLLFNVLSISLYIGIELYILFLAFARRATIGDISFYTQVVINFQGGLGGMLRNTNQIFEQSLYVGSIFDVLDAKPILPRSPSPKPLPDPLPPTIEFRDVTFRYPGSKTNVLEHFSLVIEPKQKIAFVGENGAGKSTIIKLLARFYDVNEGQILINGIDIRELDLAEWHKQIGILFQDFNRYEDTAQHNIYYGNILREKADESIKLAAAQSGADDIIDSFEKKYEQMLGLTFEKGVELSTGQWQKMALARAYFRNAPVLVLDEPTAAIDAKAEQEIFERVEKLSADKTVILISHRFSTVRRADSIVVLFGGSILEQGTHDELMKKNGLYAELFGIQAKGYL